MLFKHLLTHIENRLDYWYEYVSERVALDCEKPKLIVQSTKSNKAGQANRSTVWIYSNYAVVGGLQELDNTIAHELCHSFQRQWLPGCKTHGEMFYFLFHKVCGFEPCHTHRINTHAAKQLHELFVLAEKSGSLLEMKIDVPS